MDYLSAVPELNYMTQIVIMLYEDNNKVFCVLPGHRDNSADLAMLCCAAINSIRVKVVLNI